MTDAPSTKASILNLIAFQAGWWICILGAANGSAWVGACAVMISVAVHLYLDANRRRTTLLYLMAGILGLVFETLLAALGLYRFNAHMIAPWLAPPWLIAMWINLATTLPLSLRWMQGKLILAGVLGLLSAPPTYYAGMRLGALEFGPNMMISLSAIGLLYAVTFPLLVWVSSRLRASAVASE